MKKSNVNSVKVKPVKVQIGEKEYDFILNLNSFAELEDQFGTINDLMFKMEQGSIKAIRALIWAGLLNNDDAPSVKEVGANIGFGDIERLSKVIADGMGLALPQKDESDPN